MSATEKSQCNLNADEIVRYGRQIILPSFGSSAQERLKNAKVLVVGAGGLGCSLLVHLGGMGVGKLGIIDGDVIDVSNLHRQLLYTVADVGKHKAACARVALLARNPTIECEVVCEHLSPLNAEDLVKRYDLVVDCTDNMPTRYLINDAAILNKKVVVSGSALGMEGQISVYGAQLDDGKRGPCYRCLFPQSPSPQHVGNCNNGGVLGCIPGIIGSLQALEVVKLLIGAREGLPGALLLLDGESSRFQRVNLQSRSPECRLCGDNPTIITVSPDEPSYQALCSKPVVDVPSCSVTEYQKIAESLRPHLLLDVRNPTQFKICSLKRAVNIPLAKLPTMNWSALSTALSQHETMIEPSDSDEKPQKRQCLEPMDVFVICRRGVDSLTATRKISECLQQGTLPGVRSVTNVAGGYVEWSKQVDPLFPLY